MKEYMKILPISLSVVLPIFNILVIIALLSHISIASLSCRSDLNTDGIVDFADFLIFSKEFGSQNGEDCLIVPRAKPTISRVVEDKVYRLENEEIPSSRDFVFMAYLNLSERIPDNSLIFLELSYNDQTRTIYCKPNFTSPDYIQDRSWVSLHYRIAVRKVRDSSRIFMVTENFANHSRVEADFVNLLRFDNEVQERVPNLSLIHI